MSGSNKRLQMLEKMAREQNSNDPFVWYGLAMEYRREGRTDDALETFRQLRSRAADYLPMYLMAGQVLIDQGQNEEAKEWLERGQQLAEQKGDRKALGEIEDALDQLG